MRKLTVSVVILVLFAAFAGTPLVFGKKVATFDKLVNPFFIEADENQLYITDGPTINIFSLKDFNLVKQFGKAGDGVKEFKVNPRRSGGSVLISVEPDYIMVNSIQKISYFTKDGKFIKEVPVTKPARRLLPLGNRLIGEVTFPEDKTFYVTRVILDSNFKIESELYRRRSFFQREGDINPFHSINPITQLSNKRIFINGDNEIYVFDRRSKILPSITWQYDKIKITEEHKKNIRNWYRTYPGLKHLYDRIKDRLKFPAHFPAIRLYNVADKRIYVLSHKKEGGKSEFIIMDLAGKLIKKTLLPFYEKDDFLWFPYTIKNGNLYQLVKNKDKSLWELQVTPIE